MPIHTQQYSRVHPSMMNNDENGGAIRQNKPSIANPNDPFVGREILKDVTNSSTQHRNVFGTTASVFSQGKSCIPQQQPLKPQQQRTHQQSYFTAVPSTVNIPKPNTYAPGTYSSIPQRSNTAFGSSFPAAGSFSYFNSNFNPMSNGKIGGKNELRPEDLLSTEEVVNTAVPYQQRVTIPSISVTSVIPSYSTSTQQQVLDVKRLAEATLEDSDCYDDILDDIDYDEYDDDISEADNVSLPSTGPISGIIAPTSVFAQPSTSTSINQSSSFFSHQPYEADEMQDGDEEEKDPVNMLPGLQPLYYFRTNNSGCSPSDKTNGPTPDLPKTSIESNSMRSVIFAKDVETDVLMNMRQNQNKNKPSPRYMEEVQTDITPHMRCILIDWMNEVACSYSLLPETVFLSVNIVDRALSRLPIRRSKLQAVGVTALFISAKYCEISPPTLKEFVYVADNTYGKDEVISIEKRILNELDFELCSVQPYDFIEKFLENCGLVGFPLIKYLSYYLCEIQLQNYDILKYAPTTIAASSIMISLYLLDMDYWTSPLAHCFGFSQQACQSNSSLTEEDHQLVVAVNACLESMFNFYVQMASGQFKHDSVKRKYSNAVFFRVGDCVRKLDKGPPSIPN